MRDLYERMNSRSLKTGVFSYFQLLEKIVIMRVIENALAGGN